MKRVAAFILSFLLGLTVFGYPVRGVSPEDYAALAPLVWYNYNADRLQLDPANRLDVLADYNAYAGAMEAHLNAIFADGAGLAALHEQGLLEAAAAVWLAQCEDLVITWYGVTRAQKLFGLREAMEGYARLEPELNACMGAPAGFLRHYRPALMKQIAALYKTHLSFWNDDDAFAVREAKNDVTAALALYGQGAANLEAILALCGPAFAAGDYLDLPGADAPAPGEYVTFYSIAYDGNAPDATKLPQKENRLPGAGNLSAHKPERADYVFFGWAEQPGAALAQYLPGGAYTLTRDVTLYAVWEPAPFSVTLHDAESSVRLSKVRGIPLALPAPPGEGRTFKGWAESPAGPPVYAPGSVYTADAPAALYAVWLDAPVVAAPGSMAYRGAVTLTADQDVVFASDSQYITAEQLDARTVRLTSRRGFVKTGSAQVTATAAGGGASTAVTVKVRPSFWQWLLILLLFGWIWM